MPLEPHQSLAAWQNTRYESPEWNCMSCGEHHEDCECEDGPEWPYEIDENNNPRRRK